MLIESDLALKSDQATLAALKISLGSAICGATGAKAFTAQNGPARLRFEWHAVRFAALIANDIEPLAFASTATTLACAAKVSATRVAARLATFGVAQTALAIVVLLSFRKGKRVPALGTRNFQIWHRCLPRKAVASVSKRVKVYSSHAYLYSANQWQPR